MEGFMCALAIGNISLLVAVWYKMGKVEEAIKNHVKTFHLKGL